MTKYTYTIEEARHILEKIDVNKIEYIHSDHKDWNHAHATIKKITGYDYLYDYYKYGDLYLTKEISSSMFKYVFITPTNCILINATDDEEFDYIYDTMIRLKAEYDAARTQEMLDAAKKLKEQALEDLEKYV